MREQRLHRPGSVFQVHAGGTGVHGGRACFGAALPKRMEALRPHPPATKKLHLLTKQ